MRHHRNSWVLDGFDLGRFLQLHFHSTPQARLTSSMRRGASRRRAHSPAETIRFHSSVKMPAAGDARSGRLWSRTHRVQSPSSMKTRSSQLLRVARVRPGQKFRGKRDLGGADQPAERRPAAGLERDVGADENEASRSNHRQDRRQAPKSALDVADKDEARGTSKISPTVSSEQFGDLSMSRAILGDDHQTDVPRRTPFQMLAQLIEQAMLQMAINRRAKDQSACAGVHGLANCAAKFGAADIVKTHGKRLKETSRSGRG